MLSAPEGNAPLRSLLASGRSERYGSPRGRAIKGDGPWKVDEAVVHVLNCHGADHVLASAFEDWRQYLQENVETYPPRPPNLAIARRHGAVVNPVP